MPAGSCELARSSSSRGVTKAGGVAAARASTRTRASVPSTRSVSNQWPSPWACSSTGRRVVGRMAEEATTACPTSEETRVDLPAPVEPPTTASTGASADSRRGRT